MADGKITIETDIDTTGITKGVKSIKSVSTEINKSIESSQKNIEKAFGNGSAESIKWATQLKKVNVDLTEQTKKLQEIDEQLKLVKSDQYVGPEEQKITAQYDKVLAKLDEEKAKRDKIQEQIEYTNSEAFASKGETRLINQLSQVEQQGLELETKFRELNSEKETLLSQGKTERSPQIVQLNKELEQTGIEMDKVAQKAENLEIKIADTHSVDQDIQLSKLTDEYNAQSVAIDKDAQSAASLKTEIDSVHSTEQIAQAEKLTDAYNKQAVALDKTNLKAKNLGDNLSNSFKMSLPSVGRFARRVSGLIKRVFIYTVIVRALRSIKDYFSDLSQGDRELQQDIANLKFALQSLMTPLFNLVIPVLKTIIIYLTKIVMVITDLIAKLQGTTLSAIMNNTKALQAQSASAKSAESNLSKQTKSTKKLTKATKDANKQLATFDELNTLSFNDDNNNSSDNGSSIPGVSGTGISPDTTALKDMVTSSFSDIESIINDFLLVIGVLLVIFGQYALGIACIVVALLGKYKEYSERLDQVEGDTSKFLDVIEDIILDSLIVIGFLLCMFGQLPLGIGLIVAGVLAKGYKRLAKSNQISDDVKNIVGIISGILSVALIVIGIICCLTVGGAPIGIALIIAGATLLTSTVVISKQYLTKDVSDMINGIIALVAGVALIVFGIIACCSGVGIALGIPLIVLGIAALGYGAFNGAFGATITKKIKDTLNNIGTIVKDKINSVVKCITDKVHAVIDWWNKLKFSSPSISVNTSSSNNKKSNLSSASISSGVLSESSIIPPLAKGAVIPSNAPFLAQLGDQKNGTNLETPESLLRDIFTEQQTPIITLLQQLLNEVKQGKTIVADGKQIAKTVNANNASMGTNQMTGGFAYVR